MLTRRKFESIVVVQTQVDFRKQHEGLIAEAQNLGLDVTENILVVFVGRVRNRTIKILYSDRTGVWVATKKFAVEQYRRYHKILTNPKNSSISNQDLYKLVELT
jgi:hypothetical protein